MPPSCQQTSQAISKRRGELRGCIASRGAADPAGGVVRTAALGGFISPLGGVVTATFASSSCGTGDEETSPVVGPGVGCGEAGVAGVASTSVAAGGSDFGSAMVCSACGKTSRTLAAASGTVGAAGLFACVRGLALGEDT